MGAAGGARFRARWNQGDEAGSARRAALEGVASAFGLIPASSEICNFAGCGRKLPAATP